MVHRGDRGKGAGGRRGSVHRGGEGRRVEKEHRDKAAICLGLPQMEQPLEGTGE